MGHDLDQARAYVQSVMASGVDTTQGLSQLLAYCRSVYPADAWGHIAVWDVEDDTAGLRAWLASVLMAEPPEPNIAALWFGLYESELGYRLYVAGVEDFDPVDTMGDWATDPTYWPDRRDAPSIVLRHLPMLLTQMGREAAALGNYVLVLGYACLAIAEVLRTIDATIVVGARESRGIAVGFDDGDFVILGIVTADGLRPVA